MVDSKGRDDGVKLQTVPQLSRRRRSRFGRSVLSEVAWVVLFGGFLAFVALQAWQGANEWQVANDGPSASGGGGGGSTGGADGESAGGLQ